MDAALTVTISSTPTLDEGFAFSKILLTNAKQDATFKGQYRKLLSKSPLTLGYLYLKKQKQSSIHIHLTRKQLNQNPHQH